MTAAHIRDFKLKELLGLEKSIYLVIGDTDKVAATYDESQVNQKRISSVQYLSFDLGREIALHFLDSNQIAIFVDHPAAHYKVSLTLAQLNALKEDLRLASSL